MEALSGAAAGNRVGKLTAVLLYVLEQGPVERQIIKIAYKSRMPVPDKFNKAPTLLPGLELYFSAYDELVSFHTINAERPPILWADVHEYAKHHRFDSDQRENLMHYVRDLEQAALTWRRKKLKTHGQGNQTTKPKDTRAKQTHHRKR